MYALSYCITVLLPYVTFSFKIAVISKKVLNHSLPNLKDKLQKEMGRKRYRVYICDLEKTSNHFIAFYCFYRDPLKAMSTN